MVSKELVHEKVIVNGVISKTDSYMIHNALENFEEVIKKINILISFNT